MKYIFKIMSNCIIAFMDFILCNIKTIYTDVTRGSNSNDDNDLTYVNLIYQHPIILI